MTGTRKNEARLMGLEGSGYAVVESLPSLGKGLSCTGIFVADSCHRDQIEAAWRRRSRVPFRGVAHYRHFSREVEMDVELRRVDLAEDRSVTVEFLARNVPKDLCG